MPDYQYADGKTYGNDSWGVTISSKSVASALSADDRRLFYETANQRHFKDKKLSRLGRPENVSEVFDIGKRRTKNLGVRLNVAQLQDRSNCAYNQFFHEHPLEDTRTNYELAKHFKGVQKHASLPNLGGKSAYGDFFGSPPSRRQIRQSSQRAKAPEWKGAEASIQFGSKTSTETSSWAHKFHSSPPPNQKPQRSEPVKATLGPTNVAVHSPPDAWRTAHQRFFKPQTAPAYMGLKTPEAFRGQRLARAEEDEDPLALRRAPYLDMGI